MAKNEDLDGLSSEELIKIIQDLRIELEQHKGIITMLAKSNVDMEEIIKKNNSDSLNADNFNEEWAWVKKLVFIVKQYNHPVSSSEILTSLISIDTTARYWRNKVKSLSVKLNKAAKYKMLIGIKIKGVREYYYALPEWVSEHGELLPDYKIKN